jgi:hypothetical protein
MLSIKGFTPSIIGRRRCARLLLGRARIRQRLAHHLAVNTQLLRYANSFSRRISSNSSTLLLHSIPASCALRRMPGYAGVGQFTVSAPFWRIEYGRF